VSSAAAEAATVDADDDPLPADADDAASSDEWADGNVGGTMVTPSLKVASGDEEMA